MSEGARVLIFETERVNVVDVERFQCIFIIQCLFSNILIANLVVDSFVSKSQVCDPHSFPGLQASLPCRPPSNLKSTQLGWGERRVSCLVARP